MELFAGVVLALGVLDTLLLLGLAVRRIRLARDARRHDEALARLRPLMLAFIEGEAALPEDLPVADRGVLADALGAYGRLVTGPARTRITRYFEEHGIVDEEIDALAHARHSWRRAAAAFRLGDMRAQAAEYWLIAALDDPTREVRSAALRSLGRLQSVGAVAPIVAAVAAGRVPVALARWAVLQAGTPALPELRRVLDAPDPARRAGAVMLIGLLGDASDAGLVEARLRDTGAQVRVEAARALGRLGADRSAARLVVALDDRVPAVRAVAAASLGRLRADAVEPLLRLAVEDRFEVARAAAIAVAALDIDAAAAHAGDSDHLRTAVALARLA